MFPVKVIGEAAAPDSETAICAADGGKEQWRVPEETPVALVYNRRNYAVMLATPQDLVDFATGFTLTERIVGSVSDILGLDIIHTERGADLRLRIAERYLERFDLRQRRRNLPGNTGCGVCGLENADTFFEPLPRVANKKTSLNLSAGSRELQRMSVCHPINQRKGA
ncbi:Sulfur carrier protein FdhD, partial [hydrothermal vent metagenome]